MGDNGELSAALVVTNPGAGAACDRFLVEVLDACERHICQISHIEIANAEEAAEQVAGAVQELTPEIVISIGGDGTARAVAEGMVRGAGHWNGGEPLAPHGDGEPSLLVLPAGSGNSLYSLLWGETPWKAALQAVFAGTVGQLRADLIRLREINRASVLGANFGLIADTVKSIERMKAASEEALSADERYAAAFAEALNDLQPFEVHVAVDGETVHRGIASMVTVGGVARFGGGKTMLLPRAAIDDGLLDVCVLEAHTVEELTALVPFVVSGTHTEQPGVRYVQGREVLVDRLDGAELSVEHDGDPWPAGATVTLAVMPAAVSLLAGITRS
jgi:diacylglycerol kinase (ATP)